MNLHVLQSGVVRVLRELADQVRPGPGGTSGNELVALLRKHEPVDLDEAQQILNYLINQEWVYASNGFVLTDLGRRYLAGQCAE